MKESTNKTSTRAQAGKSKTEAKSTSRTTTASSQSGNSRSNSQSGNSRSASQSGRTTNSRTSHVNNPEVTLRRQCPLQGSVSEIIISTHSLSGV